jgi:hypothetical protein
MSRGIERRQKPLWKMVRKPVAPPTIIHQREVRNPSWKKVNIEEPKRVDHQIVTLLTDFGLTDAYVGVMKGVISKINPEAKIIDLSHNIPPFSISSAAYILKFSYTYFPAKSCHLAVVDPGVGSDRRAIAIFAHNQYFVGPDNGVFTYILEGEYKVVSLENPDYFSSKVSCTFYGRDVFAPVAGHISRGVPLERLGSRIKDPVRLSELFPEKGENRIKGMVVHIDRFGNIITNITSKDVSGKIKEVLIADRKIEKQSSYYVAHSEGEVIFLWGSGGHLEISVVLGNAEDEIGAKIRDEVEVFLE